MENLLQGKKAVITGGTSGIGKAIVQMFLEAGADVVFWGTNEGRGEELKDALSQSFNGRAHFVKVDVSKKEDVVKAANDSLRILNSIDILVNCAGIVLDNLLLRVKEADIEKVFQVNLSSCFFVTQAFLRNILSKPNSKIINISSVVGMHGNAGQTVYAASKAGIIGFTKSLAKELAARSIQVNCVAPGFVETKMTDQLSSQQKEAVLKTVPMQRMASPHEIASVCLFFASGLSNYITGQVLAVDGGMVI